MWKKFDKHSQIYRTKSNIENFKISVTLKTISSLLKVPKFEKSSIEEEESAEEEDHMEKTVIKWQEKILSRTEIEYYKDIENCSTDIQKKYHEWIVMDGLDEMNRSERKIFTYVCDDNYEYSDEIVEGMELKEYQKLPKTKEMKEDAEVMYVFADLNPDTLIFMAKWWQKEGILLVYPDFNDFEKDPYFVEIDTDYRHLYSYAVKNVSKVSSIQITKSQNLQIPKIPSIGCKNLPGRFNMPPRNSTRIVLLLNIQEAEGFEYDALHVRYQLEYPETMKLENGDCVGSTHGSQGLNGCWKFGYCFQIDLISTERFTSQDSIKMFLEIISIDSWQRERNEGFACLNLAPIPGLVEQKLQCYRLDYGFLEKIERYFIGGRRKFDLQQFYTGNEGFLNRYASKVITSGTLSVQSRIITQKSPGLVPKISDKKGTNAMTLDDIMKAYQVARRRLEATTLE